MGWSQFDGATFREPTIAEVVDIINSKDWKALAGAVYTRPDLSTMVAPFFANLVHNGESSLERAEDALSRSTEAFLAANATYSKASSSALITSLAPETQIHRANAYQAYHESQKAVTEARAKLQHIQDLSRAILTGNDLEVELILDTVGG